MKTTTKKKTTKAAPAPRTVLVLRTCNADMTSAHDGKFRWPESGPVEAPDWLPTKACGNGLHGALKGQGEASLLDWSESAKWLVVRVVEDSIVDLGGKVKFPRGEVIYCGDRSTAANMIADAYPGEAVIGATRVAGDGGTASAGYGGTASAGYGGTASAGYGGTASAGYGGTASAGPRGTASAGDNGIVAVRWWDDQSKRYRMAVGYVGEDGIEKDVKYRYDVAAKRLVKAT